MDQFMNHDFSIEKVHIALHVLPGKGAPVHHNRPFHGLALHISNTQNKHYIFSDGKRFSIGENEIIYLPKGSDYIVSSKELGGCYAINFELPENCSFAPFTFKAKNAAAFINEFEQAALLWKNKNCAYHMKSKAILYRILAMMQEEYRAKYMAKSSSLLIAPALDYIHGHYAEEEFSIAEFAKMCRISEDYFRKIFKSIYGSSPRKYINGLKLSHARELIISGLYSVGEVCFLSGFNDESYFSREFKKCFGKSPKEYAKASRE